MGSIASEVAMNFSGTPASDNSAKYGLCMIGGAPDLSVANHEATDNQRPTSHRQKHCKAERLTFTSNVVRLFRISGALSIEPRREFASSGRRQSSKRSRT
jgi:hypothetical protein